MKNKIILLLHLMLLLPTWGFGQNAAVKLSAYKKGDKQIEVFQSYMGGGGYITGIVQDHQNSDVLYARSDVAGVFKSIDGGKSWQLKNSGLDKMSDNYCHSLAMDPFDNNVLLRASGDVRNFKFIGRLHRSVDGGESWQLVKDNLDYYGNGPTRTYGELIAFNPDREGEVAVGSFSEGVWLSEDKGLTWRYGGLKGERMGSVQFHADKIYLSTIADAYVHARTDDAGRINGQLHAIQDFRRDNQASIYVSEDRGYSWNVLYANPDLPAICEMIVMDQGETILFISTTGVYRSDNGGKSFAPIPQLPVESYYRTLTQSPIDSAVMFTAATVATKDGSIPIYQSKDKGLTWQLISVGCQPDNLSTFPDWHGTDPNMIADSRISHIQPDNADPDKLYISNWWGVTITDDLGKNYQGNYFDGIGIICCEALLQHPSRPNQILAGICDHAPMLSENNAESFAIIPARHGPARIVCLSKFNPNLMLYTAQTKREKGKLYRSMDGGQTASFVWQLKNMNYIQDIKEDPIREGRFWLYLEGDAESEYNPSIYVSDDFGATWDEAVSNPFAAQNSVPLNEFKIDNDLNPIVNYQYKNGCGTGQLLTLDNFRSDVIYAGEWTSGLFRSMDGGKSWQNIAETLPFDEDKNQVLQLVYADPYREGVVYAGFWNSGLWKSDDFGDTWRRIAFNDIFNYNISSMSINRDTKGNEMLVVACSNHPLGEHDTALWISEDNGRSWLDVYDYSIGCSRFISVISDVVHQRIYTATAGNGVFYFDLQPK